MKTVIVLLLMTLLAIGLSATLVTFNDQSNLTNFFNSNPDPNYINSADGGLGNSGCVYSDYGGNEIWTQKSGIAVPGVGGTITISAYFRNSNGIGYGGLGVSTANSNSSFSSCWIRDVPALGTNFHGGGGAFLNNNSEYLIDWYDITGDLPVNSWYKMIYTITNQGSNLFDLQLQIWNSDSSGNLGTLFTQQNATNFYNESITESTVVYPYFGFSESRFDTLDDYQVNQVDAGPTLPVELSSFTAIPTADYFVNLQWTTESETNLSGYYIYRNTDVSLTTAMKVSNIISGTNSSQTTNYAYTDSEVETGNTYFYWLQSVDMDGTINYHGPINVLLSNPDEQTETPVIPTGTRLMSVFPNPFNPSTTIPYQLKTAETVRISIYNSKGQLVKSYLNNHGKAGCYSIRFDGKDMNNNALASGMYHIVMKAGKYSASSKMVLLK